MSVIIESPAITDISIVDYIERYCWILFHECSIDMQRRSPFIILDLVGEPPLEDEVYFMLILSPPEPYIIDVV